MVDHIDLSHYSFKALIFDCDNTLAKTAPHHFASFGSALKQKGYDLPRDWYFERVGVSGVDMLNEFKGHFGASFDAVKVNDESSSLFRENSAGIKAVEPVARIARDYYKKLPMAVASGGIHSVVEATLQSIGVRDLFEIIVTIDDVKNGKPEPDLFLLAAQKLGVDPSTCLVFEDSDEGIKAAHAAHMQVIDVRQALGPDYLQS